MDYITNTLDCAYNTDAAAYTGADGGLPAGDLRWWGLTVDVEEIIGTVPTEYSLNQNYPNPFNPVTNITYSVPKESHVKVEVFDMLGRSVAECSERIADHGRHQKGSPLYLGPGAREDRQLGEAPRVHEGHLRRGLRLQGRLREGGELLPVNRPGGGEGRGQEGSRPGLPASWRCRRSSRGRSQRSREGPGRRFGK